MGRPSEFAHGVPSVEGPGEKQVLGSDDDHIPFWESIDIVVDVSSP